MNNKEAGMKTDGFSLIEVLVSMALALVLIIGTTELISYSLWAKKKGDLASGLAHAATSRLEALKAVPIDAEARRPGEYEASVWDDLSMEALRQEWTIAEAGEGLQRVILTTRSFDYPESELRLMLLLSRDIGFRP
jgi:prepilin-type N-terminal cleavage/methylation domain-containing protein